MSFDDKDKDSDLEPHQAKTIEDQRQQNHPSNGQSHHPHHTKDALAPPARDPSLPLRLPFLRWLDSHFSWSYFTCTQSTGGIAVLLSECPKQFHGLETIGIIIFIFNIFLFVLFTFLQLVRWRYNPGSLKRSFTTAPECYFFGSYWLSAATMILNMQRYGVPHLQNPEWLLITIRILFWIYAANSFLTTNIHILIISKYVQFKAIEFAAPMFILILNAMLTGTVAGAIAESQPPNQRVPIMVAGVAYQGLGWIVCMMFLTLTFANLLEKGWAPPNLRPGLFILTGTTGFTIVALITNARACPVGYGFFATHPMAPEVLLIVAVWSGVFMWLFSLWCFGIAFCLTVCGLFRKDDNGRWKLGMSFSNVAWAIIFPNVGWVISTIYLGQELESEGVLWVSVAMIILLTAIWLLDLVLMVKAVGISLLKDARIKIA